MVIQAANAVNHVRDADMFHVDATLEGIDWETVVDEMDALLGEIADDMAERYREKDHLTLFEERTSFVDERTVELDGQEVTGEGRRRDRSRPVVPPIDGLEEIDYLTSKGAVPDRTAGEPRRSGRGYIAVELGYVFESIGTDVTVIEMMDSLVPREDGDVSETFTEIASDRHDVYTGHRVTAVEGGRWRSPGLRRDRGRRDDRGRR